MTPDEQLLLAGWLGEITFWIGLPVAGFFVYRYFKKRRTKVSTSV